MRWLEIREAPEIIGDENFGLSDQKINTAVAADIKSKETEVLGEYPGAKLVHLKNATGGIVSLVSDDGKVEYFAQYVEKTSPILGRCATQIKLWRSANARVRSLASKVFDNFLMKNFDTVVSDTMQTTRGREFWKVMLAGSRNEKTIGVLSFDKDVSIYDPSENYEEWIAATDGWGKSSRFRNIVYFVSNLDRNAIMTKVDSERKSQPSGSGIGKLFKSIFGSKLKA